MAKMQPEHPELPQNLFDALVSKLRKLTGVKDMDGVSDESIRDQIGGFSATSTHRKPTTAGRDKE
jgi:hypothetical protein